MSTYTRLSLYRILRRLTGPVLAWRFAFGRRAM